MIDYIDKNARWKILSFGFAVFVSLFALSVYISPALVNEWHGISIGCALILVAVITHRLGKKNTALYILSVCLNAIGTGFAVSAYYIVREKPVIAVELVLVMLAAAVLYTAVNLLISFLGHKRLFITLFCALSSALLAVCAAFWIFKGQFAASFGFFNALFLLFFISVSAITLGHPERVALRDVSFAAFGSFVVAVMIVIAILSEGDIVDGFDIADVTNKNKKAEKAENQPKIPRV